jgi:hypothetical protein
MLLRAKSPVASSTVTALKRSLADQVHVAIRQETSNTLIVETTRGGLELHPTQRQVWDVYPLESTDSLDTPVQETSAAPPPRARPLLKLRPKP